jgi:hypothetical protein
MLKDLFNEILRRLEWSRARGLEPTMIVRATEYAALIPIDESLVYKVSVRKVSDAEILIRSFFPDGDTHYYTKLQGLELEEAASIIHAAALVVYGRLLSQDPKK